MMSPCDHETYDVIVVGARVAGASTALLLARAGHRVLVVDRDRLGTDTLSTHALMRPAVLQLERWGVLDAVIAAGTPPQHQVVFRYDDEPVTIVPSRALYAPRRTVLDPLLVAAAERAGAEVRFGVDVREVLRDPCTGRVVGVGIHDRAGDRDTVVHARWVVGADGRRSRVAADVGAPVTRAGTVTTTFSFGYWAGVETAGYEWAYAPELSAGVIPTNDGLACVFVGVRPGRSGRASREERGFLDGLARTSPTLGARVPAGRLVGPIRTFPGLPGWLRRPWGDGWALVGDAGYFKDPATAHGISDALRDAELLAHALHATLDGRVAAEEALRGYEATRDRLSLGFFAITERVASFDWTIPELRSLHLDMSREMQCEVEELEGMPLPGATLVP